MSFHVFFFWGGGLESDKSFTVSDVFFVDIYEVITVLSLHLMPKAKHVQKLMEDNLLRKAAWTKTDLLSAIYSSNIWPAPTTSFVEWDVVCLAAVVHKTNTAKRTSLQDVHSSFDQVYLGLGCKSGGKNQWINQLRNYGQPVKLVKSTAD